MRHIHIILLSLSVYLCISPFLVSSYDIEFPYSIIPGSPQVAIINGSAEQNLSRYVFSIGYGLVEDNLSGHVYKNGTWLNYDDFPFKFKKNEKNRKINFKVNNSGIIPGKNNIYLLTKNENDTILILDNTTVKNNSNGLGNIEIYCGNYNGDYIELIDDENKILHRFDKSFFEVPFLDTVYYRFPVESGIRLRAGKSICNETKNITFILEDNETIRRGNIYDIGIESVMPYTIYPLIEKENIFKIINYDHKTGEKEELAVEIYYEINGSDGYNFSGYFIKKGLNSYTATGTGSVSLEGGNYTVCGYIKSIRREGEEIIDPVLENNVICDDFIVELPSSDEMCSPEIYIENKSLIYGRKFSSIIRINNISENKTYDFILKINLKNKINGEKEEAYIFLNNESEFEFKLEDYSLYEVLISIADASCDLKESPDRVTMEFSSIEENDFGLTAYLENKTYLIGEKIIVPVYIYNGLYEDYNFSFETKIKRNVMGKWKYEKIIDERIQLILSENSSLFEISHEIENESITGYYKIQIRMDNGTNKRYSNLYFLVDGLPDLGEGVIKIIDYPQEIEFGSMSNVLIDFYSGNINYDDVSFVSYVNRFIEEDSIRYPVVDFNLDTLYSKIYEQDTAVRIGVERGKNYIVSVPLFLTPNCEDKYESGLYGGSARVYYSNDRSEYKKEEFYLEVKEGDGIFCSKNQGCSSSHVKKDKYTEVSENETLEHSEEEDKFSYPHVVYPGQEFEVIYDVENINNKTKDMTFYSYVFNGTKLASMGLSSTGWKGGWTANSVTEKLEPSEGRRVILQNKIKEDMIPGSYDIRLRKIVDNKKYDITDKITIIPKLREEKENLKFDLSFDNSVINFDYECDDCYVISYSESGVGEIRTADEGFVPKDSFYVFALVREGENEDIRYFRNKNIEINNDEDSEIPESDDINLKENPEYNGILEGAITGKRTDIDWKDLFFAFLRVLI